MQAVNRRVIAQFRAGGEVEGMHRDRLALLTTTGRKSGRARTTPMMHVVDGDGILVIACNMGAKRHPGWLGNLQADPKVHVELDGREFDAIATVLPEPERAAAWARITADHPFFLEHERSAERVIPVVRLDRA